MLYSLSKQLGSVLSLPISLHHSLAPVPSGVESRMHYNALPEVALASSAIVVLKLVYGLDGKRRLPRIAQDVACTFPDVDQFLATLREANRVKPFINNHPFSARIPMSVGDLGHASLDEYLDFCEETLVAPQTNEHRILDNYFPLSNENVMRSQTVVTSGPVTKAGSPMKTNDSEPDILRPGESYTIYHSEDVLGNVPSELDVIIQRACRWAGVSSDYLCSVVEQYERRLVRWWQAERQYEGGKRWEDGTDAAAA